MTDDLKFRLNLELSDREFLAIGMVIAHWGRLEHEIFHQVLRHFHENDRVLPAALNSNVQFTSVLDLWEETVVAESQTDKRNVLEKQLKLIRQAQEYRNALVHGMWEWNIDEPQKITATRIKKKEVLSTQFTAQDLEEFASALGEINFQVRYPGGIEQYVDELDRGGSSVSRHFISRLKGSTVADDLHPEFKKPSTQK